MGAAQHRSFKNRAKIAFLMCVNRSPILVAHQYGVTVGLDSLSVTHTSYWWATIMAKQLSTATIPPCFGFFRCRVDVWQNYVSRNTISFVEFNVSTLYIFAYQVFSRSCVLRHICLRSFAVTADSRITRTLDNSNLALIRTKIGFPWLLHTITVILPTVTLTLDNSNLPLTRSNFCFPSDYFYINLPSLTRTMFWAVIKGEKNSAVGSETLNFEFFIDVLEAYSLLVEAWQASFVCHKSKVKQRCFSKQLSAYSI